MRLWSDLRLVAYTLGQAILFPIILAGKLRRHLRGYVGEFDRRRWSIRTSNASQAVVFVGAGPGELIMMDRIVAEMRSIDPDLQATICLRDLDALDRLQAERPDQRFCVWPFDHLVPVAKWIKTEDPALVVFVDRFRFPVFSCGLSAAGIPVALVNGRCRTRNSAAYRLAAAFYRWQVSAFQLLSMEDEASRAAILPLAKPSARVIAPGSLKADLGVAPSLDAGLRRWLHSENDLPIVAAGSTRNAEEERLVLGAFVKLRAKCPCRLLLAPRNPERAVEVAKIVEEYGLSVGQRSLGESGQDVQLLDTFGELSMAYSVAQSAYVGGFTGDGGGHNFMEPLRWGVPVAYGPNRGNFASLQTLCEGRDASKRIHNAEQLADFWAHCIEDPTSGEAMGNRGRQIVEESRGATAACARELLALIPDHIERKRAPEEL